MAQLDPSIILSEQKIDPVNAFRSGLAARKEQMVNNAFAQQQADEDNLNNIFKQTGGDPTQMQAALAKTGTYAQNKTFSADQAAADKERIAGDLKKLEIGSQLFGGVNDQPSYTNARNQVLSLYPDAAQHIPEQYNPQQVQQVLAQGMSRAEQLKNEWEQKKYDQENYFKGQDLNLKKESNAIDWYKAQNPATSDSGASNITDDAVTNAAARYNIDGTMPPLGIGKTGGAVRASILNKAALLAQGIDPNDQRVTQISNKANSSSLAQIQKQQNIVSAFENTATKNADLALNLSDKVDRTGIPFFNKWLQAGRTATGDVDTANFNSANETFVNEYAKVMSGSMGNTPVSDSMRAHAHDVIGTADTQEQYKSRIALLKQEMANRMSSFDEEKSSLTKSMGKSQQPGTQPADQSTQQYTTSGW